ncbi:alpha/beta hydrolase [Rhodococcus oxybenzonivorans]|uniref:alpha/beta hydrolase n=1 Tax=Rhodococcus TaxID=1827 RepID=UPI00131FC64E|nr:MULTISPECIES: alpha/beta hydrolase [Rhodococcus]MDV7352413.1 alpha/beta hydrolase [Rhodococcus oxybenzonivorans]QHE72159.1 hypothetical protein GFS60_05788 [Rhodococcus sp. WAY2]
MELTHVAVGDGDCTVRLDGPASRHAVLLLPGAGDAPDVYDDVCARLHNSDLRTIVPESIEGLDDSSVMGLLDELKVGWVNLVGSREGAELAWTLAARQFGRFASLVVADRGHPAAPDDKGLVREAGCPPVELPTTVMVGSPTRRAEADASGRFVYSDFRVVDLDGVTNVPASAAAALATEIVLRTSPW